MTALVLLLLVQTPPGYLAREVKREGARFQVVTLDTRSIAVSLKRECAGERCERLPAAKKGALVAMNAGIFEPGLAPTGLLVVDGKELSPLNTAKGEGNFFLQPNGVFFIGADGAPGLATTSDFAKKKPKAHGGRLNGKFSKGSSNLNVRNAVGVKGPLVRLVLSLEPVSFHALASLFRDVLKVDEALYLDGFISELAADGLKPARAPEHDFAAFIVASPR
ncbi:MAG: phosphodiester glycosidase family protein [Myxococcales bacterium]|nr:phosphodiester glycosidase family protein [Myxococcales bacterium]